MSFSPALDAYFERIGYAGSRRASQATLDALIAAHTRAIPFENLDVLLGRGISLDPADIEHKLVHERRGGYCFEHNAFFMHVLEALGYSVQPLGARVRLGRSRSDVPPRTHLFLRVELASEARLVDVGFGGLSPTSSLRLVLDERQETPHEPRRIVSEGHWQGFDLRAPDARLFQQAWFRDAWHDLYDFTLEPMAPSDREVANWYASSHPESHFRQRLIVARATPEGRLTLTNDELVSRINDGSSETRRIGSQQELLDVLAEHFGLRLVAGTRFECSGLAGLG